MTVGGGTVTVGVGVCVHSMIMAGALCQHG